jgi:hypothetical protein
MTGRRRGRAERGTHQRTTLLTSDPSDPDRIVPRSEGPWVRLLVRLFALSLDRQLADGCSPEDSRLLAARADWLVSPSQREALADSWDRLVARAHRPQRARTCRVPLCRERVVAAEADVRDLRSALLAPLPVPVRGVAAADQLLRDGEGPLYRRACSADLRVELRAATAQLSPWLALGA